MKKKSIWSKVSFFCAILIFKITYFVIFWFLNEQMQLFWEIDWSSGRKFLILNCKITVGGLKILWLWRIHKNLVHSFFRSLMFRRRVSWTDGLICDVLEPMAQCEELCRPLASTFLEFLPLFVDSCSSFSNVIDIGSFRSGFRWVILINQDLRIVNVNITYYGDFERFLVPILEIYFCLKC